MFALFSTFEDFIIFRFDILKAGRPWFADALREESGGSLDVGAKKQIRHLSALFEEYNRAKSQGREESQNFRGMTDNDE